MSVNINADTTNGLVLTSDTSGEIKLQSAGADIATVDSSGITMASGKTLPAAALTGSLPAGMGGKILQVISVHDRQQSSYTTLDIASGFTNYGFNEAGFDLTTLDIALTPSSTSSKILIMTNINIGSYDQQYGVMRLKRGINGATPTFSSTDDWISANNSVAGTLSQAGSITVTNRYSQWVNTPINFMYLDSPNTTDEVKYRFNFRLEADQIAPTCFLNRAAWQTNDYGASAGTSNVTLMEVAG